MKERTPLRRERAFRQHTGHFRQLIPKIGRFFARKRDSAEHQNVSNDFTAAIRHAFGIPIFATIFTERFDQNPNSVWQRIRRLHGRNNRGTGGQNGLDRFGGVFCQLPEIGGIFDGHAEGLIFEARDSSRLVVELLLLQERFDLFDLRLTKRSQRKPVSNPSRGASTDSPPAEFLSSSVTPGAGVKLPFEEYMHWAGILSRPALCRSRTR